MILLRLGWTPQDHYYMSRHRRTDSFTIFVIFSYVTYTLLHFIYTDIQIKIRVVLQSPQDSVKP